MSLSPTAIAQDGDVRKQQSAPFLDSSRQSKQPLRHRLLFTGQIVLFVIIVVQFVMFYRSYMAAAAGCVAAAVAGGAAPSASSGKQGGVVDDGRKGPDFYQTSPELWAGPTPTGPAAFLAQSNPAPFPSMSYVPPTPLETQDPIAGRPHGGGGGGGGGGGRNIFHLHGELSHYFPNPDGFGIDEYALPAEARIVQLHMLSRHGARYPTMNHGVTKLAAKIAEFRNGSDSSKDGGGFKGSLEFLNGWDYMLGNEILVPVGKLELFESGTLHQYMYGHLYPNDGSKIIARSTTQDRMTQSAEYFLAGFFGLDWTKNATLVLAIEDRGETYNNTLAGYANCPNSNSASRAVFNATSQWVATYLSNATERLHPLAPGFNWTLQDSYHAQALCAYETVALGYSPFCSLFTYEEWEGYEYSVDVLFAGLAGFQSPTGRAVGIGYVQELIARLQQHVIAEPVAQVNVTLDNNTDTFPLNQTLYFDFSHDTNIMGILTAFGLTQFAPLLPSDHILPDRHLRVSHVTPFAARLDMEIIKTPAPLDGARSQGDNYEKGGAETTYVHFILNQRSLPLGWSFPECPRREDGWCELGTFLKVLSTKLDEARYEHACFGEYDDVPYGTIKDGVPV